MCNTLNVALAGISGQMNKFLIDLISTNKKLILHLLIHEKIQNI